MTIREAIKELEKENYSNDDLLTLLEYYIEEGHKDYRDHEKSRIYFLALKKMILNRMKEE